MEECYSSGIAFIFEGDTEKEFYHVLIAHFAKKHRGYELEKCTDKKTGEVNYVLSSNQKCVLIKFNVVGTITQITNSGAWFQNRCYKKFKSLDWTVFLCYDTDNYNNDISKFFEGDWKVLRNSITKNRNSTVIDLAAQADIEDIMLLDIDAVYRYLGLETSPIIPSGKKGKTKIRNLFRDVGATYHEGERAKPLIESLDMDKIISLSTIPFLEIERKCFF